MSITKILDRTQRIDMFIQNECTGNPEEFAQKIGISRSMLYENLDELRSLGAPIRYSRKRRTFYYATAFTLLIKFQKQQMKEREMELVEGGEQKIFTPFFVLPMTFNGPTSSLSTQNNLSADDRFCRM